MHVEVDRDVVTTLRLTRGKVNPLNGEVVAELNAALDAIERDDAVRAIVLTGREKFFSFGFDIPEFISYSKERFTEYLIEFTALYTRLFEYPKPVVAALNGHAIAGGCMLALACDVRIMTRGPGKISLNEIGFGSSVFAGSVEMLKFACGGANASEVLYSGKLYSADEARAVGLIHEAADGDERAREVAAELAQKDPRAFASMKTLLRASVAEEMRRRERASIDEFVEIWYSPSTWANLQNIRIR